MTLRIENTQWKHWSQVYDDDKLVLTYCHPIQAGIFNQRKHESGIGYQGTNKPFDEACEQATSDT